VIVLTVLCLATRRGLGRVVGKQHHGHEQREGHEDGKGGSVEYEHDWAPLTV
jgi:hypothetical protein